MVRATFETTYHLLTCIMLLIDWRNVISATRTESCYEALNHTPWHCRLHAKFSNEKDQHEKERDILEKEFKDQEKSWASRCLEEEAKLNEELRAWDEKVTYFVSSIIISFELNLAFVIRSSLFKTKSQLFDPTFALIFHQF